MAEKSLSEILGGSTRFGRLIVIGEAPKKGKHRRVEVACDCGELREVYTFSLTSGATLSCGCLHRERARGRAASMGRANRRHGGKNTAEYRAWQAAISRCELPTHAAFARYGGRGITVCERWRTSFEAFLADMGPRPSKRHTLERIDNSKGYSPDNCEWRQWEAQNRNRRNTVIVEWRGRLVPLAKIAARTGVNYGELHRRVIRYGWDVERALRTPLRSASRT